MIKANMSMERRGAPRFTLQVPVKYRVERDEKILQKLEDWRDTENNAHTLDMSLGGMQIAVDQPLAMGDVLHFEINLLNKTRKMDVYARVIRVGKKSAGLQFHMMDDAEREALKAFFEFLKFSQKIPKTKK